jgi:hypothetical protein
MIMNVTLVMLLLWILSTRSKPSTRRDVVNMLHDVSRDMICLCRNILEPVFVFPDVEVCNKQIFNLLSGSIELNPLESVSRVDRDTNSVFLYILAC